MSNKNTTSKENKTEETKVEKAKIEIPEDVSLEDYITVKNGFNGKLIYVSRRTGEEIIWNEFGEEQELELKELKNAKSSAKSFFRNNWFIFEDEFAWVPYYLGVGKFYENSLNTKEMSELFDKPAGEIKKILAGLSDGQKRSLAYKARYMVSNDLIDSNKTIKAFEEGLGINLTER